MPLVEVYPIGYTRSRRSFHRYLYRYRFEWIPSYTTIKRYLRKYSDQLNFKRGKVEVHKYGDFYTYQYIPVNEPAKCMLVIDPKNKRFYTTEEELKRLVKEYNLKSIEDAKKMCNIQAMAFSSLLKKIKTLQMSYLEERFSPRWIESLKRRGILKSKPRMTSAYKRRY